MTVSQSLISFVLAAGMLTVTPGLDTALVLRTATVEGATRAAQAALGVVIGCLFWGSAAAFGLGALLAASEFAFGLLRWLGGAYLLWLGLQLTLRPRTQLSSACEALSHTTSGRSGWFWKGLLQNLFNPKIGAFYLSFLPQCVPQDVPVAGYTLLLSAIHAALGLAWFTVLILAMRPLVRLLRRPNVIKALDRLTGCVFIGFGAKLALSPR